MAPQINRNMRERMVVWSEEGRTHGEIAPVVVDLKLGE